MVFAHFCPWNPNGKINWFVPFLMDKEILQFRNWHKQMKCYTVTFTLITSIQEIVINWRLHFSNRFIIVDIITIFWCMFFYFFERLPFLQQIWLFSPTNFLLGSLYIGLMVQPAQGTLNSSHKVQLSEVFPLLDHQNFSYSQN